MTADQAPYNIQGVKPMKRIAVNLQPLALSAALAASLMGASASAWADALPIGPSVATFTPGSVLEEAWPSFGFFVGAVFQGVAYSPAGLTLPVAEVTVDGQGPGPIRVSFGPDVAARFDTPQWSLIASDLAFDVGSKSLTMDLTVRTYNTCAESGAEVCAAWFSMDHDFEDLALLTAPTVTGAIDGGMPLDQAVVLQTLVPQKLELSADLYLNYEGMNQVMNVIFPIQPMVVIEEVEMPPVMLGNLTITPVPELSTSGMLAAGMVGLAALARRRRASS
jgi:hypothetical protein